MIHFGKAASTLGLGLLLAVLMAAGLAGCAGPSATGMAGGDTGIKGGDVIPIRVGDTITVVFSDAGIRDIPPFEDKVKEDGTITLHLNQQFKAAGLTALELQKEILKRYVPNLYVRMTVSVKTGKQFYTVSGQVRTPSQYEWIGQITVTRAIATAGDFTDFGSKRRVTLIRANGEKVKVDCIKAINDPAQDPQVYPGDTISVPRRGPFG